MRILRIAENEKEQVEELAKLIMSTKDEECSLQDMIVWINNLSMYNSVESKFIVVAIVKKGKLELVITRSSCFALLSDSNFKNVNSVLKLKEWIIGKGVVLIDA